MTSKLLTLVILLSLVMVTQSHSAGNEELCNLDGCVEGGWGISFGNAGRITFSMDYPTNTNSYSCSATPSVQIWCRGGDDDSNWEPVEGALLIEGGLMMYSNYQPAYVCKGVIGNAITGCTKFSIRAVAN